MPDPVEPEDIQNDGYLELAKQHKCEVCTPGAPRWLATYSDIVTLLLTFFVLLLSFAKTETAKYESALGSIRNAFGGNIFKQGEVLQLGKSPDNQVTMLESQTPVRPFPVDFLTVEGFLDKHEINRESAEDLREMKAALNEHQLTEHVDIYEVAEGIKVRVREKIFFKRGSLNFAGLDPEVFRRILALMRTGKWTLFIQGHASRGERSGDGRLDAFGLSALRAQKVTQSLVERGVLAQKITSVFYGDAVPNPEGRARRGENAQSLNRRVDFILRKMDLNEPGRRLESQGL